MLLFYKLKIQLEWETSCYEKVKIFISSVQYSLSVRYKVNKKIIETFYKI